MSGKRKTAPGSAFLPVSRADMEDRGWSWYDFLIVNGGVIVPQYGDENDALAVQQIQAAFDEAWGEGAYKAVGVRTDQVVFGGGNIHCITQQEPSA